jgi:hypothetical protein
MRWLIKLGWIILLVYIAISLVFHEFRIRQYNYYYHQPNWLKLAASIFFQPVVDLWFNRKTTYFFDWQKIRPTEFDNSVLPLTLRSTKPRLGDYRYSVSTNNLQSSLGFNQEAVIIAPMDYDSYWSLVFCVHQEEICQKNNLFHKGPIKILLDGELDVWGITQEGKVIRLKVVEYVSVAEYKEVLFI